MNLKRPFLLPLIPFYYLGSLFMKKAYDWGFFKSTTYETPTITVGNISTGGTGKSPFVAYLIEKWNAKKQLATLSRGYKRSSKGYQLVTKNSTAALVGDEPLQIKTNFPKVHVAVDADRRNGIQKLIALEPKPELIIFDDAFQHRKIKADFQIILTAFNELYVDDFMLPAGNLREPISAANRADTIIVTKCPKELPLEKQQEIVVKLNTLPHQKVFFTSINYNQEIHFGSLKVLLNGFIKMPFCLVTGIANPTPLTDFLVSLGAEFTHLEFPDHHNFTNHEIDVIKAEERILTTEKDYMRLQHIEDLTNKLHYLPITISFLNNKEEDFLNHLHKRVFKK